MGEISSNVSLWPKLTTYIGVQYLRSGVLDFNPLVPSIEYFAFENADDWAPDRANSGTHAMTGWSRCCRWMCLCSAQQHDGDFHEHDQGCRHAALDGTRVAQWHPRGIPARVVKDIFLCEVYARDPLLLLEYNMLCRKWHIIVEFWQTLDWVVKLRHWHMIVVVVTKQVTLRLWVGSDGLLKISRFECQLLYLFYLFTLLGNSPWPQNKNVILKQPWSIYTIIAT